MATIYLVRHGQASLGSVNYDQLSAVGHRQARLTGEWLRQIGFTAQKLVCGSLQRHEHTLADLVHTLASPVGREQEVHPGFNEMQFEEIIARTRPNFSDKAAMINYLATQSDPKRAYFTLFVEALQRWASGKHDGDYTESWPIFRDRCMQAVKDVAQGLGQDDTALVVTSGGPIAAIVLQVFGLPDYELYTINRQIVNTSITVLKTSGNRISVHSFNGYPHLESCGDKAMVTAI